MGLQFLIRTPPSIGGHILEFCRDISPGSHPVWVETQAVPGMRSGSCFQNVRSLVEHHGGEPEYGWLIWEWRDTLVEAEHHALWRRTDGARVEATPRDPHEDIVLFLPDPERVFDFQTRRRLDNRRQALRSNRAVRTYLKLAARRVEIEEAHKQGVAVSLPPNEHREISETLGAMDRLYDVMASWSIARLGRNDSCLCGSGHKYKHCCLEKPQGSALHPTWGLVRG